MTQSRTPAEFSAALVATLTVVRTAAGPSSEHARQLASGRITALVLEDRRPDAEPASIQDLGETPAAISRALVEALFGSERRRANTSVLEVRRPGLSVQELPWDACARYFEP